MHDSSFSVYGIEMTGYDLRTNTTPAWEYEGRYSTEIFSQKAKDIMQNHDKTKVHLTASTHYTTHDRTTPRL